MAFENAGLVPGNTVVVADNVVYRGAPDFLDHVEHVPAGGTAPEP